MKIGLGLGLALLLAVLVGYHFLPSLGPYAIDVPPAISGTAMSSQRKPLSDDQVRAVSHWLATHRTGWHQNLVTAPSPAMTVELRHADGTTTKLDLYWEGTAILSTPGGGGIQKFSAPEIHELVHSLGG